MRQILALFFLVGVSSVCPVALAQFSFAPTVDYDSRGLSASSVAIADVNRDGKPDIVVANWGDIGTNPVKGNGDGTFQPAVAYDSGGYRTNSVAVADVNGDGKLDLVVANEFVDGNPANPTSSVGVLLGNGDGTFQPAVLYDFSGVAVRSVAVADVNGDGKPDLLVATGRQIGVMLGNGDGTFQPVVLYASPDNAIAISVVVADVNRDGKPDLIVDLVCDICATSAVGVGVMLGNGDGTFQPVVSYGSGGQPLRLQSRTSMVMASLTSWWRMAPWACSWAMATALSSRR